VGVLATLLIASALVGSNTAQAQETQAIGSVTGKVVDKDTGAPLNFANVVILGTQWGGNARNGGAFNIPNVPVGT